MLKKHIALPFLFVSLQVIAQEKRELDWQDLKNSVKTADIMRPVRFGEFTIFQINDINKFLYKVEIQGQVFELQTPMPSELQTLFRLTPTELQKTATNKKSEEAVGEISEGLELMRQEKKALELRGEEAALTAIESQLDRSLARLLAKCERYLSLSKSVSNDVFLLKRTRNDLISIAQYDLPFAEISTKLAAVKWPFPDIRSNYIDLKSLYHEVELLYEASENEAEEVIEEREEAKRTAAAAAVDDINKAIARAKNTAKNIKESLEKIERADELIDEEALLGLLTDVDFLYSELSNKNNFKVIAPPVQMDGDIVTYRVMITPAATRSLAAYRNPMEFQFDVPTRGGLKVDFSVGPALSIGKGSKDEQYYLEDAEPDSVILRSRKNNNFFSPGVAALMHFYSRSGNSRAWGGLLGIGAGFQSMEDVDLSIYLGASLVLGKQQKVIIGGGFSFLRVERLKKDQFIQDKKYAIPKINLPDVTEKVFKPSGFLSVTYSLASRVERN